MSLVHISLNFKYKCRKVFAFGYYFTLICVASKGAVVIFKKFSRNLLPSLTVTGELPSFLRDAKTRIAAEEIYKRVDQTVGICRLFE